MRMNDESGTKIGAVSEAGANRRSPVLENSSLQNFSRRMKHLKRWVNAKIDSHHERTMLLRVHRQNRTD